MFKKFFKKSKEEEGVSTSYTSSNIKYQQLSESPPASRRLPTVSAGSSHASSNIKYQKLEKSPSKSKRN